MSYAISEPIEDPQDDGDRAANTAEVDRDIALRRHLLSVQVLEDQIIDAGGMVWCLDCEASIPPERLEQVPHAVRCVGCQEAHELHVKQATGRKRP